MVDNINGQTPWDLIVSSPHEAADLKMRAKLVVDILVFSRDHGISRPALMKMSDLSFAECHALYRGEIDLLTKERLQEILGLLL